MGVVGEARLPSCAHIPWTADYTPYFLVPVCLSEYSCFCPHVYRIYDFPKYDFDMFISGSSLM